MALTATERDLCAQIGFDSVVAEKLKAATGKPVEQLRGLNASTDTWSPVAGLSAKTTEKAAQELLDALQPQLPAGYKAFYSERSFHGENEIAVLKTSDPLDIVRVKATSAGNYEMDSKDIVARLQQWQQLCHLNIVGAGHDWVIVVFETLPADLDAFGEEIYEFCPDTIDQHFGCFGDMADAMEEAGEELPAEMIEVMAGLDWNDPDKAGMELLKHSLQQTRSLFLWWD